MLKNGLHELYIWADTNNMSWADTNKFKRLRNLKEREIKTSTIYKSYDDPTS